MFNKHDKENELLPLSLGGKKYRRFSVDRVLGWIVDSVVSAFLVSLGITSFFQSVLIWFVSELQTNFLALSITSTITFTVVFVFLLYIRSKRPNLPRPPKDYAIEALKIQMEYLSREDIIYSRSFRLKVLSNGMDSFRDTFHWSGSSVDAIKSSDRFHKVSVTDEAGLFSFYEVYFNSTYNKGDIVDFTITWRLKDKERIAHPFVARQIDRPYRQLSFLVKLYPGPHEKFGVVLVATSPTDRTHSAQKRIRFNKNWIASWVIRRPLLAFHYELRWSSPDWQ